MTLLKTNFDVVIEQIILMCTYMSKIENLSCEQIFAAPIHMIAGIRMCSEVKAEVKAEILELHSTRHIHIKYGCTFDLQQLCCCTVTSSSIEIVKGRIFSRQ